MIPHQLLQKYRDLLQLKDKHNIIILSIKTTIDNFKKDLAENEDIIQAITKAQSILKLAVYNEWESEVTLTKNETQELLDGKDKDIMSMSILCGSDIAMIKSRLKDMVTTMQDNKKAANTVSLCLMLIVLNIYNYCLC